LSANNICEKKHYNYLNVDPLLMIKLDRATSAVREWLPLASAAAAISFIVAFIMRVPLEQTLVASALAAILVFSGLLFRSFGKDREKY
jgi:hypothetical protein